jgi:hypothetical protein
MEWRVEQGTDDKRHIETKTTKNKAEDDSMSIRKQIEEKIRGEGLRPRNTITGRRGIPTIPPTLVEADGFKWIRASTRGRITRKSAQEEVVDDAIRSKDYNPPSIDGEIVYEIVKWKPPYNRTSKWYVYWAYTKVN